MRSAGWVAHMEGQRQKEQREAERAAREAAYHAKQLDNVTIGITDMQGNTYHYEVTTIPACTYYAVSIDSLPSGQYYLCVYQGSNYVIGMFTTY